MQRGINLETGESTRSRIIPVIILLVISVLMIRQGLIEMGQEEGKAPDSSTQVAGIIPAQLRIPELALNSPVVVVERLNPLSETVGWLSSSPKPGATGTAVIIGPTKAQNRPGGSFSQLKIGDKVHLASNTGQTLTFEITRLENFSAPANQNQTDLPADISLSTVENQLKLLEYQENLAPGTAGWRVVTARLQKGQN